MNYTDTSTQYTVCQVYIVSCVCSPSNYRLGKGKGRGKIKYLRRGPEVSKVEDNKEEVEGNHRKDEGSNEKEQECPQTE